VSKTAIGQFTHHIALEEADYNICAVAIGPNPPGITGIATEDAPEEARARMRNVEVVGNRFVIAATAPMELSGKRIDVQLDGKIVALD
jgi:NAD(P)-dependent dehydrogenase (short-subunit alcohol dehydrogenase family)